jgi:hypothetical protein
MSKRFIDTGLFDDPWFMDLSKDGKLLWIYMITRCDHAGIIELNTRLVKFQTDIKDLSTVIQELSNRLVRLDQELTIFFIPKFITFQYPNFPNSNVNQQQGAIKQLEKYSLFEDGKIKMNCSSRVDQDLTKSYGNDNGNEINKKGVNQNFQVPTLNEIIEYCKEKNYTIDPEHFFNHYEARGWMLGKQKMKSWKAAIVTWVKNEKTFNPDAKKQTQIKEYKSKFAYPEEYGKV